MAICLSEELKFSTLYGMDISTGHIVSPREDQCQRAYYRHNEVGPSTFAPYPPPCQTNWQQLFNHFDDIEYQLVQVDTRMHHIEEHLCLDR